MRKITIVAYLLASTALLTSCPPDVDPPIVEEGLSESSLFTIDVVNDTGTRIWVMKSESGTKAVGYVDQGGHLEVTMSYPSDVDLYIYATNDVLNAKGDNWLVHKRYGALSIRDDVWVIRTAKTSWSEDVLVRIHGANSSHIYDVVVYVNGARKRRVQSDWSGAGNWASSTDWEVTFFDVRYEANPSQVHIEITRKEPEGYGFTTSDQIATKGNALTFDIFIPGGI